MTDDSLFREVDEEVRADEYKKLWDRYGTLMTAAAVAVIVTVAGYKGWQYWQAKQSEAAAVAYFDAVKLQDEGKADDARRAFDTIGHAGFGQLVRLREAAALAHAGKRDDAVKAFDAFAADDSADASLRDLAKVRAAYLLADTLKPDELLPRIGGFDTEGSPWRNAAREVFALSAFRAGDYSSADRYLAAIAADGAASIDMRLRSQKMLQLLTPLLAK